MNHYIVRQLYLNKKIYVNDCTCGLAPTADQSLLSSLRWDGGVGITMWEV